MLTLARGGTALFSFLAVMQGFWSSFILINLLASMLIFLGLPNTGFLAMMGSSGLAFAKARILLRVDHDESRHDETDLNNEILFFYRKQCKTKIFCVLL